jgi:hypothetical protein
MPKVQLIDPEELRALLYNTIQIFNKPRKDWVQEGRQDRRAWIDAANEALRFCAISAQALGDASLLILLVEAAEAAAPFSDPYDNCSNMLAVATGIRGLLADAAEVPEELGELCQHSNYEIRAKMAEGLVPRSTKEIELLELLAADPVTQVRSAAKKSLASRGEVPWWAGKFSFDPLSRLSPEESIVFKPVLEGISAVCNKPYYQEEHAGQLIALVEKLPPVLVVDIAELCLSRYEVASSGHLYPLGTLLFSRGGGVAAALRLVQRWVNAEWGGVHGGEKLAKMITPLPAAERLSLCLQFLQVLQDPPKLTPGRLRKDPLELLSGVIASAWPSHEDPTPVLEAIFSIPERGSEQRSSIRYDLLQLFAREDIDISSIQERVVEAFLSGCPGPWKLIGGHIETLLKRLPTELMRTTAERAITNEDKKIVRWGLWQLTGTAHRPELDLPKPELIKTFMTHPRFRELIFEDSALGRMALPLLRTELREGKLGFLDTAIVMNCIDSVYGGLLDITDDDELPNEYQKENQKKVGELLGPEELRGVPTDEEWRRYRALRDEATLRVESSDEWRTALKIYPVGVRDPQDRAFLVRAIERSRAGADQGDLRLAMSLASANPVAEDLPFLDELIQRHIKQKLFLTQKERILKKLGLAQNQDVPEQWMDEDEDD